MKHLLVTAATAAEIAPFVRFLEEHYQTANHNVFQNENWSIHILISGVGMMATAFALGKDMAIQKYDAAIQAGIAGSFDLSLPLGTVVSIISEQYGDLGAEDKGNYIDIFELGFLDKNTFPFKEGKLYNDKPLEAASELQEMSSLSINTVSGNTETILQRKELHNTGIESMEGIAFHYACLQNNVPFLQVRAVSNYVTPRDKSAWQIKTAIDQLNDFLQTTITNHYQ